MKKIFKFIKIIRLGLFSALFKHNVAASVEHYNVLTALKCATVVDIGANRGQFSLIARHRFPGANIIAFEPLPKPASQFLDVFANDDLVVLHNAAIGKKIEKCEMHISAKDDSSSLLPISELQEETFPGTKEVGVIEVKVSPLDTFVKVDDITSPALLKLDVQGFELDALQGCETLLSSFNWVYCECSFVELYTGQSLASDVIEWLYQKGFRIEGIYNHSYDDKGTAIQADFLFKKSAAHS